MDPISSTLSVSQAAYAYNQGRPVLLLKINDHVATISAGQKFINEGYVYLNTPEVDFSWEDFLAKIKVPPCELTDNREMEILGHTDNPTVVHMTKTFLNAVASGSFETKENIPIESNAVDR
jgi:hypothetical protein